MQTIRIISIIFLLSSINCLIGQSIQNEYYVVKLKNKEVLKLKYKDIIGDSIIFTHDIFGDAVFHKDEIQKISIYSAKGIDSTYYSLYHTQNYFMDSGIMPEGGTLRLRSDMFLINRVGYSFNKYLVVETGFIGDIETTAPNLILGLKVGHSFNPNLHLAVKFNLVNDGGREGFYTLSPIVTIGSTKNNLSFSYNFTRASLNNFTYKDFISVGGIYTISDKYSIKFENLNFLKSKQNYSAIGLNWNHRKISFSLGLGIITELEGNNAKTIPTPFISGIIPLYTPNKKFNKSK